MEDSACRRFREMAVKPSTECPVVTSFVQLNRFKRGDIAEMSFPQSPFARVRPSRDSRDSRDSSLSWSAGACFFSQA